MLEEKRIPVFAIILIFLIFLGTSLFINLPALQKNFLFADEAIYYSMTQSLAQDGNLEYTKKDLIRYYQDFDAGPIGIFLKKGKNDKIFYAKSFAYPLFAVPFVKIFGSNGFFVFHSFLLLLILLMGYSYFSLSNKSLTSLLCMLTFLFASITIVYFIWISPDFFNFFLVLSILFLWLYKLRYQEKINQEVKKNTFQSFLLSDWTDYIASALIGIAVFSKPPNIVLMGLLIIHSLVRKKFLKSSLMILVFLLTSGLFWGTNYLVTGEWNYQGGERKTFYHNYPLEQEHMTFDSLGHEMTSEGYGGKHFLPPKVIIYNLFYYFWGRFTGIAWYFFPALLSLILFFFREKYLYQWLILSTLTAEILIYAILMPDNYAGGGGALANRYFLNIYPLFLFLPSSKKSLREIGLSWVMATLFISQILVSPILHSHFPATHAKKFPFKFLPVELTLFNNFPTSTDPNAFKVSVSTPQNNGYIHHLDDNFYPKPDEENGIWTKGPYPAEMILETHFPVKDLIIHLLNNPRMKNEITVKVGWKKKKITLGKKQRGTLTFSPGNGFQMKNIHLYKIKIKASKGSIPYFEEQEAMERRFLGVFFELEIIPEKEES